MNNEIINGFDNEHDDSLQIDLEKVDDTCLILHLKGYIDTYNSLFFQSHVSKAIASGFVYLLFDCENLTYVSSTGIGAFSIFLKTVKPRGGDTILVALKEKVYEVFHLLGFSNFFTIRDTISEAIACAHGENASTEANVFPAIRPCPVCKHQLKLSRPGRYRCICCKTILAVNNAAHLSLG